MNWMGIILMKRGSISIWAYFSLSLVLSHTAYATTAQTESSHRSTSTKKSNQAAQKAKKPAKKVTKPSQATSQPGIGLIRDRENYQRALKALDQGRLTEFDRLSQRLSHYSLYPYLLYYRYRDQVPTLTTPTLEYFLTQYKDTAVAEDLKVRWIHHLAREENWHLFLKKYQPTPNDSISLQCHYSSALYHTGKSNEALNQFDKVWKSSYDLPLACDSITELWLKSPHFSKTKVWEKIEWLITKNQTTEAKYLAKSFLSSQEQPLVDLWIQLDAKPQKLYDSANFLQSPYVKNSHYHRLIRVNLEKLFDEDVDQTIALWHTYAKTLQPNYYESLKFSDRTARWVSYYFRPDSFQWLNRADPHLQKEEFLERRIRVGIRRNEWYEVLKAIQAYPITQQAEPLQAYWHARASLHLQTEKATRLLTQSIQPLYRHLPPVKEGLFHPTALHRQFVYLFIHRPLIYTPVHLSQKPQSLHQEAHLVRKTLALLAKERSFYGFMAADFLNRPPSLNIRKITVTPKELAQIEAIPAVARARELDAMGYTSQSQREWKVGIRHLSKHQRSVAAKLAQNYGWHAQAMLTAAQSDGLNDIALRFPRLHQNTILSEARSYGIDPHWVMSVIRQESAFNAEAKSPVGAMGLMQLMPETAKEVSKKVGVRLKNNEMLLMPNTNIKFGTYYLSEILEKFDNNLVLATAAYNAGPTRVKGWLPTEEMKGDIWVESIPIKETREYVKNIMTYQLIYQYQMGVNPKLTASLDQILPK